MKSIAVQLREAFEASELSVQELLDRSKLPIDRSSLARKLSGDLRWKDEEIEVVATTLKVLVTAGREARAS